MYALPVALDSRSRRVHERYSLQGCEATLKRLLRGKHIEHIDYNSYPNSCSLLDVSICLAPLGTHWYTLIPFQGIIPLFINSCILGYF